ncbi:hypothetical protein, partial [Luteolibacter marinus]|uniref:hypothetical protein n=1 Tax=Luteolibacter marinus TaxID=2776705 RepID=UPI001866BC9C
MRFPSLLAIALACMNPAALHAATPASPHCHFDSLGRFRVELEIPAGTRQAVLEMTPDLASPWRKMLACPTDGRAAKVTFRLPAQGARCFARIATSSNTSLPPVELADPDLVSVRYGPAVAEEVKVVFLSSAAAKMREWASLPAASYHANLIAWAMTQPNVASAELSEVAGNVSIRFT